MLRKSSTREERSGLLERLRCVSLVVIGLAVVSCRSVNDLRPLQGELEIHDPSTIVKCDGDYWVFGTGRGILSRHSRDLSNWQAGPRVFEQSPAWASEVSPRSYGRFWAPEVIR